MVVSLAGGDGLLLLKEMQPARAAAAAGQSGPRAFLASSGSIFAADSRSISAAKPEVIQLTFLKRVVCSGVHTSSKALRLAPGLDFRLFSAHRGYYRALARGATIPGDRPVRSDSRNRTSRVSPQRFDALRPASPCRRDEVAGLIQQLSHLRVA
jgi:hypothetical protein